MGSPTEIYATFVMSVVAEEAPGAQGSGRVWAGRGRLLRTALDRSGPLAQPSAGQQDRLSWLHANTQSSLA